MTAWDGEKWSNSAKQKAYRERHNVRRVTLKGSSVNDLETLRIGSETDIEVVARILRESVERNIPKQKVK